MQLLWSIVVTPIDIFYHLNVVPYDHYIAFGSNESRCHSTNVLIVQLTYVACIHKANYHRLLCYALVLEVWK